MMNEHELISAVIAGNDGYRQLVERYHVGLIIHCEQIVKDRDDAEDIAQMAFIKVHEQLPSYDASKSRFSTWLYRIATNLAIDHLRKERRNIIVEDIELLAEPTMPTHIEDEEKREVQSAVDALMPPEYRTAIVNYYWKGQSYQQIADELNVPINTIRTWIRRAKLQLKEQLS